MNGVAVIVYNSCCVTTSKTKTLLKFAVPCLILDYVVKLHVASSPKECSFLCTIVCASLYTSCLYKLGTMFLLFRSVWRWREKPTPFIDALDLDTFPYAPCATLFGRQITCQVSSRYDFWASKKAFKISDSNTFKMNGYNIRFFLAKLVMYS